MEEKCYGYIKSKLYKPPELRKHNSNLNNHNFEKYGLTTESIICFEHNAEAAKTVQQIDTHITNAETVMRTMVIGGKIEIDSETVSAYQKPVVIVTKNGKEATERDNTNG